MKMFKLHIIKFNENVVIKDKIYLFDYKISEKVRQLISIITNDKYKFLINDGICKI